MERDRLEWKGDRKDIVAYPALRDLTDTFPVELDRAKRNFSPSSASFRGRSEEWPNSSSTGEQSHIPLLRGSKAMTTPPVGVL
jgi:hypothetical protein